MKLACNFTWQNHRLNLHQIQQRIELRIKLQPSQNPLKSYLAHLFNSLAIDPDTTTLKQTYDGGALKEYIFGCFLLIMVSDIWDLSSEPEERKRICNWFALRVGRENINLVQGKFANSKGRRKKERYFFKRDFKKKKKKILFFKFFFF